MKVMTFHGSNNIELLVGWEPICSAIYIRNLYIENHELKAQYILWFRFFCISCCNSHDWLLHQITMNLAT